MDNVLHYAKAIAALVSGVATALLGIYTDGSVGEALTVIVAVCGAVTVYAVPNRSDH